MIEIKETDIRSLKQNKIKLENYRESGRNFKLEVQTVMGSTECQNRGLLRDSARR